MIESSSMQMGYSDYTGATGYATCVLLHQALIGPYRYQSPPLCFVGSGVFSDNGGAIVWTSCAISIGRSIIRIRNLF